jgi:uncharacterized protein YndB with AHSA1/START domain
LTTTHPNGRLEPAGPQWRLRFERALPHPPDKVWRALTEPEHLTAWFPTDVHGDRAVGSPLRFVFREDEGPEMAGEVLAYEPRRLFELSWGEDVLRFELEPDGDGTRLVFTATFDEKGRGARDAAGWHVCLDVLAAHLDGADETPPDWKPINAGYQERFGPDASTVGPPEGHPESPA